VSILLSILRDAAAKAAGEGLCIADDLLDRLSCAGQRGLGCRLRLAHAGFALMDRYGLAESDVSWDN